MSMQKAMEQIDDPGGSSEPGKHRCTLEVVDSAGGLSVAQREWLERYGAAALRAATEAPGEVRVRVVDDRAMAAAHLKYSNIPGSTDVLTFDLSDGGSARGEALDVDILVCADEARRQGSERGHAVERELLLYIVHGVLHCLGHDDHDEAGFLRMHAEEDRILSAIGVGATFGSGGAGDSGAGDARAQEGA